EAAILARNTQLAVEAANAALDAFDALVATPDRAEAAYEMAKLAGDQDGLASQVLEWLKMAESGFQRLGNHRGRERALSLLVERLQARPTVAPLATADERGLIERVSWLIGSISDLSELSQRAMQMVVEQLEAERGVLLLLDREAGQLTVMAEVGLIDPATR